MQLQGCDLIEVTEMGWIAYVAGVLPWMANGSLGRTGWDSEEGRSVLDAREQQECMDLYLGKDNEPDESIWFRMGGGALTRGGTVVGI